MSDPVFFARKGPFRVADIVEWTGAARAGADAPDLEIRGLAPLDKAGPHDIASMHNKAYLDDFRATRAGAVLVAEKFAADAPKGAVVLKVADPQRALADLAARFYPDAARPRGAWGDEGIAGGAHVHPGARLEKDVTVEPGAAVGEGAEIGAGTVISANAVIGRDVRIGRGCLIGPGASVVHALIGDRVTLHAGVRVGQDGFGYAMGGEGHAKIPQIGRVIVQDDVEVGANTCIDRGAVRDTVIGEGTKIDNLVQIGHNVTVGRHCVIVALAGISGSVTIGDFAVIGGQAGMLGHITIGQGAQIAAHAGVIQDVPAGERWGGAPAKPMREFAREVAALKRLAKGGGAGGKKNG